MKNDILEQYHQEITSDFLKRGKPLAKEKESYLQEKMYQTSYKMHSLSKESYTKLLKESFSDLSLERKANVWAYIFRKTNYMGIASLAIDFFKIQQRKKKQNMTIYWPLLKTWINHIDNWAHGDMIASMYSTMLEEEPDKIYPSLTKWADNKNPWKKRLSIVSLLYYYQCRKKVLPYKKIITLLEPQLKVDHYYVQKGVGWTIRELTQAYPKETSKFLEKKATLLTSTAFSAAVEKIPKEQKEKLKLVRKAYRANNKKRKALKNK